MGGLCSTSTVHWLAPEVKEVGKKGRIMTGYVGIPWTTRESEGVVRDHMGGCTLGLYNIVS